MGQNMEAEISLPLITVGPTSNQLSLRPPAQIYCASLSFPTSQMRITLLPSPQAPTLFHRPQVRGMA